MSEQVDIALAVLDHQLLDASERRCGKVDDLELEGLDGDAPFVAALFAGSTAWRNRGRLGRLAARLTRGRASRVAWAEVVKVESGVHLREQASTYRLGTGDDRARRWVERLPGSK
jgi:hypothetical protein